jgi:hypothetical protein
MYVVLSRRGSKSDAHPGEGNACITVDSKKRFRPACANSVKYVMAGGGKVVAHRERQWPPLLRIGRLPGFYAPLLINPESK